MKDLKFIFVHGLSGWGSYDSQYARLPYWGMRNGDLMKQLQNQGYDCHAASVGPHDSAYDRACELYAQLTGTVTDYGKAHSQKYGHERYGRDFTGKPLIPHFDDNTRLVLIGHSFGGATIRAFAHMMKYGSEIEEGEDCSPFFRGGLGNRIFALFTLAAPHNGTSAYDLYEDPDFDVSRIKISPVAKIAGRMMTRRNTPTAPHNEKDIAGYDMHIDNALKLNRQWVLSEDVYYFSQPCEMTKRKPDGICVPITLKMEPTFLRASTHMGAYKGKTRGGFAVDESWRPNDGLVNTVSAAFPLFNDHKPFDPGNIEKGKWNVLETFHCDHMSLIGGLVHKREVLPYYLEMLKMISALD